MNAVETLSADPEPSTPAGVDHGKPPVMVVDDSLVFRRMAGGLIQRGLGRHVVYANDGTEALALLESVEPCVVLTDIHMPRLDGFELVTAIRDGRPEIPVVLMTAYGSESVAMRALMAGAASYVPKNCLIADLVDTLRQILAVAAGLHKRRMLLSCQTSRTGSFELSNAPDLFPALIALVQEDLQSFSIGDDTARMRVAVAVQEALENALYHGNLECSSDLRQDDERRFYRLADERRAVEPFASRRIHVETKVGREEFRIDIRDEGPGFDVASLDRPFDPEDLMRVGGRGMILIRSFLDEVIHNDSGNKITLIKRK